MRFTERTVSILKGSSINQSLKNSSKIPYMFCILRLTCVPSFKLGFSLVLSLLLAWQLSESILSCSIPHDSCPKGRLYRKSRKYNRYGYGRFTPRKIKRNTLLIFKTLLSILFYLDWFMPIICFRLYLSIIPTYNFHFNSRLNSHFLLK